MNAHVCKLSALVLSALVVFMSSAAKLTAAEPVTLDNFVTPEPNRAEEPSAERFSMEQAFHFLDSASLEWQQLWQCFTCHTNVSYLIARPPVASDAPAHREVRKYAE